MKLFLDCLPCLLRQVLESSRMATDCERLQKEIMDEAISVLCRYDSFKNSPEIGRDMHNIVKERTGNKDPYFEIKQKDLQTALSLYPKIKKLISNKEDSLYWALKAAATGNVLDSAVGSGSDIEKNVDEELNKDFALCDHIILKQKLGSAKTILVIGDNTGETVFDGILLEQLSDWDLVYAVRSAPIINDATTEEAYASGLNKYAKIMSTGCDVPGVILEECDKEFLDVFYQSDIVICKGQGNYETLSDCDRDVFFLLKAKCPVLAALLDVNINEYVFKFNKYIAE